MPSPGALSFGGGPKAPGPPMPAPGAPSFGGGPKAPGGPGPSAHNQQSNNDGQEAPERKFEIFENNAKYIETNFSKIKIEKLDLSTNPDARTIRKHISKLIDRQKELITIEKELISRRDFVEKIIHEELDSKRPKIVDDLLDGNKVVNDFDLEDFDNEPNSKTDIIVAKKDSKEVKQSNNTQDKKEEAIKIVSSEDKTKKIRGSSASSNPMADVFKEVSSIIENEEKLTLTAHMVINEHDLFRQYLANTHHPHRQLKY